MGNFFKKKWKLVLQTEDDYNNPVGICAEFRALHILEQSDFCVLQIPECKDKTPDFEVYDRYGNMFYIEVFSPRMKFDAQKMLKDFKTENNKKINIEYGPTCDIITYHQWTENSSNHVLFDICKRVLGNKINGTQAKTDQINILWIDFENSDMRLEKKDLSPHISGAFKGIYHTGSFGIWQVFYGKKDTKYFDERTWLKYYSRIHNTKSEVDGVFRQGSKWSGVIFNLEHCQILFQNPWSENKISNDILESIVRLDCFDLEKSWLDVNDQDLIKRIDCKIKESEMIHALLEK